MTRPSSARKPIPFAAAFDSYTAEQTSDIGPTGRLDVAAAIKDFESAEAGKSEAGAKLTSLLEDANAGLNSVSQSVRDVVFLVKIVDLPRLIG